MGSPFQIYFATIPDSKRFHSISCKIKDIAVSVGFGIGSCGLPAYTILLEGALRRSNPMWCYQ